MLKFTTVRRKTSADTTAEPVQDVHTSQKRVIQLLIQLVFSTDMQF